MPRRTSATKVPTRAQRAAQGPATEKSSTRNAPTSKLRPATAKAGAAKSPKSPAQKKPRHLPPPKAEFFSPEQVAETLRLNRGNASAAARVLQCHPDTIRNYCAKYPEVQAARESGSEVRLDLAEAALDRAVAKCEGWAVCFLLKTRGRARGYIERVESQNLNIDLSKLSDEQVSAIAQGEDPLAVLARTSR